MKIVRLFALTLVGMTCLADARASAPIVRVELRGSVDPVMAQFVAGAIREAQTGGTPLILLVLDTPGGFGSSMKDIIAEILNSRVPVAVYVSPSGSHAASAGFFILQAADVAAMAPGTNTGAAHPLLSFGGILPVPEDKQTGTLLEKVKNDITAYLKGIVSRRGRNVEAALEAVRSNASYTAEEAVRTRLIDVLCTREADLVRWLDGREITLFNGTRVNLNLAGCPVRPVEPSLRWRLLAFLSDPNLAVVLALVGILGLFFEFSHPGFVAPGVIGGICLVLALMGFSVLPVSTTGVLLVVLALGLFIAEIKVQGFGVIGIGGIVSLVLGMTMLIDTSGGGTGVDPGIIWGVALPVGVVLLFLTRLVIRAMKRPALTGTDGMAGKRGEVRVDLAPRGKIYVHGEVWDALSESGETVPTGTTVEVIRTEGMLLVVRAVRGDSRI